MGVGLWVIGRLSITVSIRAFLSQVRIDAIQVQIEARATRAHPIWGTLNVRDEFLCVIRNGVLSDAPNWQVLVGQASLRAAQDYIRDVCQ